MEQPSPDLKLLGMWASTFAHRVQIALKLKGLRYEYVEEDLGNKSPSLLLYNPLFRKVPVLVHDGRPICDSYVILQYIDETWTHHPLMPSDAYDRSVIRFWYQVMTEKFGAAMAKVFTSSGEEKAAAEEEIVGVWEALEGEMRDGFFKGKRFFGGQSIGMLDIILGVGPQWIYLLEEIMEEENKKKLTDPVAYPRLHAWINDLLAHEAVKEVLPPLEDLKRYVKGVFLRSSSPQSSDAAN